MIADILKILDTRDVSLQFPQITDKSDLSCRGSKVGVGMWERLSSLDKSSLPLITYTIRKIQASPCKVACPIDTDVKAYLGLITERKFEKALEVIKKDNPIPGICGRVCVHLCETDCSRNKLDQPLAICALKRFLADYELKKGRKKQSPIKITKKEKVAIVGSGPAGLTAANDLVRLGYEITIFEELSVPGGMLTTGIPAYRLPRKIIQDEIDAIRELGVKIKTNTKITDLTKLKQEGYNTIFLAIGAHKGLKLDIPGEQEFEGVMDCITFLRAVNLYTLVKIGKKVIVIGGGNAAIDSARTALRLGSDVHIVYRRSRAEMPASPWEVEEAEKEGVKIHYLASPVKIIGEKGKVVAMECIKNELGSPDASGRRRPVPIEGSEYKIPVDTIIPAISQEPDLSFLPPTHGLNISKWDSFVVDEQTLVTNIEGIFAGGDCVTGPKTIIEAIAAGHKAAKSIDRYLRGKDTPCHSERSEETLWDKKEWEVIIEPIEKKQRQEVPKLPLNKRNSFDEVEFGFEEEMAIEEAKRCLRCGPCIECYECIKECNKKLVSLTIQEEPPNSKSDLSSRGSRVLNPDSIGRCLSGLPLNGILLRVPIPQEFPVIPINGEILWKNEDGNVTQPFRVEIEPITCKVNEILCRGCGDCEKVCEYGACKVEQRGNGIFIAKVNESLCKGCGVCATVCPTDAMNAGHFTNSRISELIGRVL